MSKPIHKQLVPFPHQTAVTNNSLDRRLRRLGLFLLALSCCMFISAARAVDPPPDGDYGNANTAEGLLALANVTPNSDTLDGVGNTAVGNFALYANTTGGFNTATGDVALQYNVSGNNNTATGYVALQYNTSGRLNTATGSGALSNNTTGSSNTAAGLNALFSNRTGTQNTAIGVGALFNNIASNNTATGFQALSSNKGNGQSNTASGAFALRNNTTGSNNIALGFQAGANLTTGGKNIDIGNVGSVGEGNTIRIGTEVSSALVSSATFIAHIYGQTVDGASALPVFIDNSGRLGTVQSSARFKDSVKPMDSASEALLKLQPVTFRYKQEVDASGAPQFGLIAEQVEKVAPDLVIHDKQGKPYTVRYEAVNAMLLNEFLKEHRKVEEQHEVVSELKSIVTRQEKQIETLNASLQRVSDQLQTRQPTLVAGD